MRPKNRIQPDKHIKAPSPRKEAILEEISMFLAGYVKGAEDIRTVSEIADNLFDYLNAKLDNYCDKY